ncbi:bifunctional hydroxymethylpyrimidine kinase/phosphomethylpyrimidine kinase [Simiduia aestuariiviva]|uniref:hydroxymethylpyrimidine kinase n=1 Tax=Simiduia aestuariiviva TaxID=1510459 RepID=A0A839UR51_9GAMM|nr:bifunctional hydroxymethylpyrimidine kinase/phosphomethylpyrimidine kinase [Simiduia aestuariiviva]MBB3168949.1 hydroxymethylpyrimidine kinase/phosphomethylpyrimidine kinase/thiamine-phosphate diphosphorylase [Simiduia aestuariiviva]
MTSTTASQARPVVYAIAGIDPSGHAGLLADLRTLADLGCHGMAIPTSVTRQNSRRCDGAAALDTPSIDALWQCLSSDTLPAVVKVGLVPNAAQYDELRRCQQQHPEVTWIQDPVASASQARQQLCRPQWLTGAIITPNLPELALQLGESPERYNCPDAIAAAAQRCLAMGARAIWIKGGHGADARWIDDYFCDAERAFWMRKPRLATRHRRGTGCVLSSALAAFLAQGKSLPDAVVLASAYVHQGVRLAQPVAKGAGPVAQAGWPQARQDYPMIRAPRAETPAFPSCDPQGLYPLVDSVCWLERMLKAGVKTVQLRIKHLTGAPLKRALAEAVALGRAHEAQVFINDYWREAMALGAYGVHLGQEDLADADLKALARAGLRLGISCHSEAEWCRALAYSPSYIALGAAFASPSKSVPTLAQADLQRWLTLLQSELPVVVIGGINRSTLPRLLQWGARHVAVISAVTEAANPEAEVAHLQRLLAKANATE